MRRHQYEVGGGTVIVYGHFGRPFLVFPSEQGRAWDFETNGMIDQVRPLIDDGRAKLYCVDSYDAQSWSNRAVPLEERARQHGVYESWILNDVVPSIFADCGGELELATLGCSLGAFHAVLFGLRRADLFPLAIGMSGNYDPTAWHGWGARGLRLLHEPGRLRAEPARRPPRLAPLAAVGAAGGRAGAVGGHDRLARLHPTFREPFAGQGFPL
jgi:hypothetical protein